MQISKEEIENIKQTNNLVSVIESKGIKLKKRGKNYVALCLFHEEKAPSFTVDPKNNSGTVLVVPVREPSKRAVM